MKAKPVKQYAPANGRERGFMNRGGFLGTLFAGAIAAVVPVKAEPKKLIDLWKAKPEEFREFKRALCTKAPRGWRCTRLEGHEGPCAAELAPAWQKVMSDGRTWRLVGKV